MPNELRPWQILLVEDNLADICLMRLALNEAGLKFELTALHDGREALGFVKRQGRYVDASRPDLVVLDLMLPMYSGAEILAAMRSSSHLRDVPAVIMTSVAAPHDLVKAEALGIERQILKPCDFKEFLKIGDTIRDVLLRSANGKDKAGQDKNGEDRPAVSGASS